jgi:Protein of unknown function (DUF3631)
VLLALEEAIRQQFARTNGAAAAVPSGIEIITASAPARPVHPAQDVVNGTLVYGYQEAIGAPLVLVTSDWQALRVDQLPRDLRLRHEHPGRVALSRTAAVRWLVEAQRGSLAEILDQLAAFFRRYIVFPDPRSALLIGAWVLMTWCYRAFDIIPYVGLSSPGKRTGKTHCLDLMRLTSFNASPLITAPTETQLYREVEQVGGVQLFDEVDKFAGDKDRWAAFIGSFNQGFHRGAAATRYEKQDGQQIPRQFDVFAPRALAGIGRVRDTLEDRCLLVPMHRRRKRERVDRWQMRVIEPAAESLRDQAALACLTHVGEILAASDTAPELVAAAGVDDRLEDLLLPLVAITVAADHEDGGQRTADLLALGRQLGRTRQQEAAMDRAAEVVEVLVDVYKRKQADRSARGAPDGNVLVTPEELLGFFQHRFGTEKPSGVKSTKALAALLGPYGFHRRQVRQGDERRHYYILEKDRIADARERYGAAEDAEDDNAADAVDAEEGEVGRPDGQDATAGGQGDFPC